MDAKYKFSLPYREGMESEPGFVEKKEAKQKGHENETTFAFFAFTESFNRESIKKTDAELIQAMCEVLAANQKRVPKLASYAKKYGIEIAGGTGSITTTDKKIIAAMGELSTNFQKIAAAFTKRTGKQISVEEIQEILAV
jgi:hypothetical protein